VHRQQNLLHGLRWQALSRLTVSLVAEADLALAGQRLLRE